MSTLKQGIVIDVPAWKVPVICKKKFLTQPEIAVSVKIGQEDIKAMPDKQFAAFDQAFEKSFTPEFQKMSKTWFGDMQKTIDQTETAIESVKKQKGDPAARKKFVEDVTTKANNSLMAKCKIWTDMVQKLAQKAYDAAFEASLKLMKLKVTKAKAKMIAKVALFVILTLTAAALTIAVSVVTMGAGTAIAPVVIAGILTAGKAMFGSASEVLKNYDVLKTTIASVEADVKKLDASAKASLKAMQKTAGKLDKASAFYKALSADVGALDKHVGQLDKFIAVAQASTKKNLTEIQKLADQLAAAKDKSPEAAKIEKDVISAQRAFDSAMSKLDAIEKVKTESGIAKEAFNKLEPDTITKACGRLAPLLTLLKGAQSEVSKNAPLIKSIVGSVGKLAKAG